MSKFVATIGIADYIVRRAKENGAGTLFGIPAVYCAPLFNAAVRANFKIVLGASDNEAGYAADGYARTQGLALLSVAYGVGIHSLVAAIAGAYVERSPIVIVNGGPDDSDINDQANHGLLFSHSGGSAHNDLDTMRPFTAFCRRVARKADLVRLIDEAFATAMRAQRPAYLELPTQWFDEPVAPPTRPIDSNVADGYASEQATKILQQLRAARSPLIIAGIEVERYGLSAEVQHLIGKLGIRWSKTLLAKGALPDGLGGYLGTFNGAKAPASVLEAISRADLIVSLGAIYGSGHAAIMKAKRNQTIRIWDGKVTFPGSAAKVAGLPGIVRALDAGATLLSVPRAGVRPARFDDHGESAWDGPRGLDVTGLAGPVHRSTAPAAAAGMDYATAFTTIQQAPFFDRSLTVVADTFLGIYPAAQMPMNWTRGFVASALWASIGHSVAAAIGCAVAATETGAGRPLVLIGDGGFQTVGQSLSTLARYNLPAIVVLFDNGLYGYEQWLLDRSYFTGTTAPKPYATLPGWSYIDLARSLGLAAAIRVDSAAALAQALTAAKQSASPSFIQVAISPRSLPNGL